MNRTLFVSIFALIMSVSFNHVHAEEGGVMMSDLSVESIATQATNQYSDARVASADIRQKSHEGSCTLLVVTGTNDAWDKDLYVRSVSDLGAGVLTQSQVLVNDVNMTVIVTGTNPTLQLMESNALWWDQTLTPVSEGIDSFKAAAKTAGYTVENLGDISCQSSSRFAARRAKVLEAQRLRKVARDAEAKAKALEGDKSKDERPKAKETKASEGKTSPA